MTRRGAATVFEFEEKIRTQDSKIAPEDMKEQLMLVQRSIWVAGFPCRRTVAERSECRAFLEYHERIAASGDNTEAEIMAVERGAAVDSSGT
jgi:hypothetical protein